MIQFIAGLFTGFILFKTFNKKSNCISCQIKSIVIDLQKNKIDDAFKNVFQDKPISYPDIQLDYCKVNYD